MPSTYYSERTLDEGMAVFMELGALLDPHRPETSRALALVQGLLARMNKQVLINRTQTYIGRTGELPPVTHPLKREWDQAAMVEAARGDPAVGKDNAPADFYSAEAWAELTA